jgi:three-Cys-motif partner protein
MTTPKDTIWELRPHTKAKHELLRRYLQAWFPILNKYNERIVYIDGFSGPGRYKGGELGSPLIALEVATKHRRSLKGEIVFWFIDKRQDRVDNLKGELGKLDIPDHFKVIPDCGEFHEKVGKILQSIEQDRTHLAPTFAFIDPFGYAGIPFSIIKKILSHQHCEAFITFQVDAINRFLEHPNEKIVRNVVDAFGTEEAICIGQTMGDRIRNMRTLYQRQLCKAAKFVRYFEMRDLDDRTQYYLFFTTNHELGFLKMKEAMWKLDPDGEFSFSDATDPNQLVLIGLDATADVCSILQKTFGGKGRVTGGEVREFIEIKTPYLKRHITAALRAMEDTEGIKVETYKIDGGKRRKYTYPDDIYVTFF